MRTQWFQDLPKDQQADFKKLVLGSQKVLDKLREIVYNRVKSREVTSIQDYDSPSWAYKQADQVGYNRAMNEILELLNFEKDH